MQFEVLKNRGRGVLDTFLTMLLMATLGRQPHHLDNKKPLVAKF